MADAMLKEMSQEDKNTLRRNRVVLAKNLIVNEALINELFSKKVVTDEMREEIMIEKTRYQKADALLNLLPRRSAVAFPAFVEALIESNQIVLASLLDPGVSERIKTSAREDNAVKRDEPNELPDRPLIGRPNGKSNQDPLLDDDNQRKTAQWKAEEEVDMKAEHIALLIAAEKAKMNVKILVQPKKGSYILDRRLRGCVGRAVIISNQFFVNLAARIGTQYDVENLRRLFEQLHFEVFTHTDLSAQEIRTTLRDESRHPDHQQHTCFVLCILSHGREGEIYGMDNATVRIDEAVSLFDGRNCPALKHKPKLFFIQACQGGTVTNGERSKLADDEDDKGAETDGSGTRTDSTPFHPDPQPTTPKVSIHEKVDILIAMSTVTGYVSFRDEGLGTWFIRAIVFIFSRRAYRDDVEKMLKKVCEVLSVSKTTKEELQIPQTSSTLTKSLYFLI